MGGFGCHQRSGMTWVLLMPMLKAVLPLLPPALIQVHINLDVAVVVEMAVGVVIVCNLKSFSLLPQNPKQKKRNLL